MSEERGQAFRKKFRNSLAGWGAYGAWHEANSGPMAKAGRMLTIPEENEALMKSIDDFYESWDRDSSKPAVKIEATPGANGATGKPVTQGDQRGQAKSVPGSPGR